MIMKVTVAYPNTSAYELLKWSREKNHTVWDDHQLGIAENETKNMAERYEKIGGLLSFLKQYPDHDIKQAIGLFFGPINIDVKQKTKKKRSYSIPYLYIHEEDVSLTSSTPAPSPTITG